MNNWNMVKPTMCAKWLVLPTVYSDALSYGEQLDKFCYQLNKLIENNNILPDFIADMIEKYISSGAIGEVVRDILADYILNVKYPPEGIAPAVGDGSADDTAAIQGCIDYASANGGVVYFPYGAYLTQPLTMKDNVSLFGFDRYSTRLVLKAGATKPLINGSATDFSLMNLTLDGNSGIQVNDVNVITFMSSNVLLENLIVKDGYNLFVYNGTGGHLQIDNVIFDNAVEKNFMVTGNCDVQVTNSIFNQLSAVSGICVIEIETNNGYYDFRSSAKCDKCIVVSGNDNEINAMVQNATTPVTDTGLRNNITITGISEKQYFSGNVSKEVGGTYSKHITGVYTKTVDDNANESVDGNYSKIVTGIASETYKDKTENISGNYNKTVDGVNVEIFNGKYTKEVGGASEYTYKNNYTENVTGSYNKNVTGGAVETYTNKNESGDNYEQSFETSKFLGDTLQINTTNPLKYRKPTLIRNKLYSVPFSDPEGETYNVLVGDVSEQNVVNVSTYGAVGDGVTNDTEAVREAVEYCNENGLSLQFDQNKTYLLDGNANIEINCNVDFNWCTLKCTNTDGNVFVVKPSSATTIKTTNAVFTQERTMDDRLFNSVFNLLTPISLGKRLGTGDDFYVNVMLVTDGNGYYTNVKLPFNIIEGDYAAENVHKIEKLIVVKNAVLDFTNVTTAGVTFIRCERSNVKFSGFNSVTASVNTESRFINLSRCAFNEIERINCETPFTASGYVIGAFIADDLYLHDCNMGDANENSWGSIGISYLTNFIYERVKSNRFDCHYYAAGYYILKECECNYFTLAGGFGNVTVMNTLLNAKTYAGPLIDQRPDLQNFYNGNITFDRCIIRGQSSQPIFRYWTRYAIPNLAEFNPQRTVITFKGCKFYSEYQNPFVFNTVNQDIADLLLLKVENSIFVTSKNGIIAVRYDNTNYLNNLEFRGFKISGYLNLNNLPSYAEFNECEIGGVCTFANGTGTLVLKNNKMPGKNFGGNYGTIIYTGNILSDDRAMNDTATNKCVANNIIVAETKTNLDSWNSGVE